MDYRAEIGRRIREARKAKGLNQPELAQLAGIGGGKSVISSYETGEKLPGPETITVLAKILGRRAAYMMVMEDEQEEALLKNWRTLSEKDRMDFFRKLETMSMQSRDPVPDSRLGHLSAKGKTSKAAVKAPK